MDVDDICVKDQLVNSVGGIWEDQNILLWGGPMPIHPQFAEFYAYRGPEDVMTDLLGMQHYLFSIKTLWTESENVAFVRKSDDPNKDLVIFDSADDGHRYFACNMLTCEVYWCGDLPSGWYDWHKIGSLKTWMRLFAEAHRLQKEMKDELYKETKHLFGLLSSYEFSDHARTAGLQAFHQITDDDSLAREFAKSINWERE